MLHGHSFVLLYASSFFPANIFIARLIQHQTNVNQCLLSTLCSLYTYSLYSLMHRKVQRYVTMAVNYNAVQVR